MSTYGLQAVADASISGCEICERGGFWKQLKSFTQNYFLTLRYVKILFSKSSSNINVTFCYWNPVQVEFGQSVKAFKIF